MPEAKGYLTLHLNNIYVKYVTFLPYSLLKNTLTNQSSIAQAITWPSKWIFADWNIFMMLLPHSWHRRWPQMYVPPNGYE